MVDRVGCIKMQGLQKVLDEVELVAYMNQRLLQLSERVLGEQDQLVWVVDLGGKIMQLASKKMLEALHQLISNATTFFPNMLYKYFSPHPGSSSSTPPCSLTPSGTK